MNKYKNIKSFIFHFFALGVGLIMIYPLIWTVMSSFKDNTEIFKNTYSLVPNTWAIIENYTSGWKGVANIPFGVFLKNSTIVAVIGTIGGVSSSVLAAYAFGRLQFKGKKFWFTCVMMTLMIPNQIMVVPQYIIFQKLHLTNTLLALIAPWFFGSGFFIFLILQFVQGLPIELDEAAKIDGCGKVGIFIRIILPLVKPSIITSAIFSFYWIWQDFFQPLIFMNKPSKYTVSLALNMFLDPNSLNNYGGMFAMSVLSIIPVILVFFLLQRYLVEGVATTGLKD